MFAQQSHAVESVFNILSASSSQTLENAVINNQRFINELLLRLLVLEKYDPNNSNCNESDPRRLLQSLTNTIFPAQKTLDEKNVTGEESKDDHDNYNNAPYHKSLSQNTWNKILMFLTEKDIYFANDSHYSPSLHCVSHYFNDIINNFLADSNFSYDNYNCHFYTIDQLYKEYIQCKFENKQFQCEFEYPNGLILKGSLRQFPYPLQGWEYNKRKENNDHGENQKLVIKFVPSIDSKEYESSDDDRPMIMNLNNGHSIYSKIFYQNNNFNDSQNTKELILSPDTKTMFSRYNILSNRISGNNINLNKLGDLYGSKEYKLIDVNLFGLTNCFIFNNKETSLKWLMNDFGIISNYSIAEMAFHLSHRQWVVAIIDVISNHSKNLNNQLSFIIDITPEIIQLKKKNASIIKNIDENEIKSQHPLTTSSVPVSTGTINAEMDTPGGNEHEDQSEAYSSLSQAATVVQSMNVATSAVKNNKMVKVKYGFQETELIKAKYDSNIHNDDDDQIFKDTMISKKMDRYYITCYNNNGNNFIYPFGSYTNEFEQYKVWDTYLNTTKSFKNDKKDLLKLRPIRNFKLNKMFDFWYKHDDNNISLKNLGYLIVDYKSGTTTKPIWKCGVLLKPASYGKKTRIPITSDYFRSIQQLSQHRGQVTIEIFDLSDKSILSTMINRNSSQNGDKSEKGEKESKKRKFLSRRMYKRAHLDWKSISYFGKKTSIEQQKEFLNLICGKFEGIDANLKQQLNDSNNNDYNNNYTTDDGSNVDKKLNGRQGMSLKPSAPNEDLMVSYATESGPDDIVYQDNNHGGNTMQPSAPLEPSAPSEPVATESNQSNQGKSKSKRKRGIKSLFSSN